MNSFVKELEPKYEEESLHTLLSTHRIVDVRVGENLGIAMVVDQQSYYLEKQLEALVMEVENDNELKPMMKKSIQFDEKKIRTHLKSIFPYIGVDEMEAYQ